MSKKWTKNEINFLNKNYPSLGCKKTAEMLNRSYDGVNKKTTRLKIKTNFKILFAEKNEMIEAINNCASISEALRFLNKTISGPNIKLFKKYCNNYNIPIEFKKKIYRSKEKSIEEWLVSGSTIVSSNLKKKLYKEGFKKPICEKCGQNEWWYGEKISLILDHINGISNDNRLENLRILCPNCNAALPTHCRGYKKIKSKEKRNEQLKIEKNERHSKYNDKHLSDKQIDSITKQRKIKRPPYQQLLREIKEIGYSATGRKYGVSDNAIRKWIKFYEKH